MSGERPDRPTLTRRSLFRAAGGVALGAGLAWGAAAAGPPRRRPRPRVVVLEACAGCTGCVVACPTAAIRVTARGIEVVEERCNSCGYCASVCPVGGIEVRRHDDGGGP
ncbi:MAG: 4Fe-4S binding protein [Deltaproteobacteria bacterium]|nr:4Fe-4S binding protein [Deltaproteobacteria bacterium]